MKTKSFIAILMCAMLVTGCASAAEKLGGFIGEGSKDGGRVVTVAEAKKMKDDTDVVLEGNIVKQIGREKYTFKDKSGSITVEIDDKDWKGLEVGENDRVRIYGEVEKEKSGTEIDVDRIELVDGKGKEEKKPSGGFKK